MSRLDDLAVEATATPIALAPEMGDLRKRVRRRTRRIVGSSIAAVLMIGGVTLGGVATSASSPSSDRSIVATPGPNESAPPARPVLDGCTATNAVQTVVTGNAFVTGPTPIPGEVFTDPARGVAGPLAIVIREPQAKTAPNDGVAGGLTASAQINGREANIHMGDNLQGGATWDLAGSGAADLYSRGLTEDEIRVLAEQIDSGGTALPQNLSSIGMTDVATVSASTCTDQQGQIATIVEIRGRRPSRYGKAMNSPGDARRFDEGDSTFVIVGSPDHRFDVAKATYHQATVDEWRKILDCKASGSACASDNAGTIATTTPPTRPASTG